MKMAVAVFLCKLIRSFFTRSVNAERPHPALSLGFGLTPVWNRLQEEALSGFRPETQYTRAIRPLQDEVESLQDYSSLARMRNKSPWSYAKTPQADNQLLSSGLSMIYEKLPRRILNPCRG